MSRSFIFHQTNFIFGIDRKQQLILVSILVPSTLLPNDPLQSFVNVGFSFSEILYSGLINTYVSNGLPSDKVIISFVLFIMKFLLLI